MPTLLEKGYSNNMTDDSLPLLANCTVDDVTLNEGEDQRFREITGDTEVFIV